MVSRIPFFDVDYDPYDEAGAVGQRESGAVFDG